MSERLDVLAVREVNGKSYYTKIGAAFPLKSGVGYSVVAHAISAPVDGQYKFILMPPKHNDGFAPRQAGAPSGSAGIDLNDDVPF